ncbi:uncharacterized protein [Physcomitrium patens]|uniref:uncharacterized protein n=1 Tax=Physcomitrium patens TaxID=3218 RepID=UPI003CCCE00E
MERSRAVSMLRHLRPRHRIPRLQTFREPGLQLEAVVAGTMRAGASTQRQPRRAAPGPQSLAGLALRQKERASLIECTPEARSIRGAERAVAFHPRELTPRRREPNRSALVWFEPIPAPRQQRESEPVVGVDGCDGPAVDKPSTRKAQALHRRPNPTSVTSRADEMERVRGHEIRQIHNTCSRSAVACPTMATSSRMGRQRIPRSLAEGRNPTRRRDTAHPCRRHSRSVRASGTRRVRRKHAPHRHPPDLATTQVRGCLRNTTYRRRASSGSHESPGIANRNGEAAIVVCDDVAIRSIARALAFVVGVDCVELR